MYGRGTHHPVVVALLELIDASPTDLRALTVTSVARALNVSTCHLQHVIKRDLGTPFTKLIRQRRVAQARRVLIEKPFSTIEEVAYECGYETLTMYRHFKMELGQSPSDVRRSVDSKKTGGRGGTEGRGELVSPSPRTREQRY